MSFIDTPAASSTSTPANSHLRGKQPAVPCYAQTLSTFEVLDLFADDKTAQKICSYFEDPDTILAIDELAKISPPASTPSRSPIPMHLPQRSPKTTTRPQSSSNTLSATTNHLTSATSSAFTATDMHPDIPSETVAITQKTSNTLTPIMEELMRIFSTTPELQMSQANHTETIELKEIMDFTPSEA
ncbi:hypothetical protein CVT25_007797 [Psilocybe cyanescens]|uniref:Uncharacterized protein n=1 Tax=Psilocybe cyanescens TaxID=93625 RepID=A0A409XQU8_PSICY|nr:hypothetical protein CVT25_007797 [Psilocybe cyanescens]